MSTPPAQPPATTLRPDTQEIRIVSHSNLFYWWPVWAIGFVLTLLSYFSPYRMAIVPEQTRALRQQIVQGYDTKVDVLVVPVGKALPPPGDQPADPHYRIASSTGYGVVYVFVLLLVIFITNVPLRGLWSVVAVVVVVMLTIILLLAEYKEKSLMEHLLESLGSLHIFMNCAGYFVPSLVLFVIWLATMLLFDPQIYMVFTPGQLRVRQEIGGGEAVYDTMQMMIQKQRNDLFRHWILGLGSGDLIVTTSGATSHHFDLPNVLFVGYKVQRIEEMLREKPVVQG
jgi:hypothetical protein